MKDEIKIKNTSSYEFERLDTRFINEEVHIDFINQLKSTNEEVRGRTNCRERKRKDD